MARKQLDDDEINQLLGAHIKKVREEKGLRQTEVAYHADKTPGQISSLETGRGGTTLSSLHRIALAMGCHVSDLIPKVL